MVPPAGTYNQYGYGLAAFRRRRGGALITTRAAACSRTSVDTPGPGYQPFKPSCCACFLTSLSYSAAPSWAERSPEPTSTVICSSAGPLTGDWNSSAGVTLPLSTYGWRALIACGTSGGSEQPLTRNGPDGAIALACVSHPSGVAVNARNFFAASSFAPSVVLGM